MPRRNAGRDSFAGFLKSVFQQNTTRRRSGVSRRERAAESIVEALEERSLLSSNSVFEGLFDYQAATPQKTLSSYSGFLSSPDGRAPLTVAMDFLHSHASQLGVTSADVDSLQVMNQYVSTDIGVTHIYLQQFVHGIPVVNANVNVNLTSAGEVINVGSTMIPGASVSTPAANPALTPSQALDALVSELNWTYESSPNELVIDRGTPRQDGTLSASGISRDDIPFSLQYAPLPNGSLELTWLLNVQTTDGQSWYDASVSAVDGTLLNLVDWGNAASYRAIEIPFENPIERTPQIILNPQDGTASPFGWHDTDGVAGAEFTDTRGNNVFAQEDMDDNDVDTGVTRPNGGATLDFDFPFNGTLAATDPVNVAAATVNLFYWNNIIHDVLYHYGFNEAAGNFQFNNYGNGGIGGDQVQADALDGSGTDNANFFTPPDGTSGRMQMYEFTFTTPTRDSDMDSFIITHEFGHGLSNRLTGGPANAGALQAAQSRGMGEGWSDFLALMFVQKASDTQNGAYSTGNYVLGNPLNNPFGGIRDFPYSFDMTISPKTYGDFNPFTAPHPNGEIIAATLWDLNWLLINGNGVTMPAYGFDSDLYNGTGGNNLAMQLFVDALKLQPSNPTFLDFRDAVLRADQIANGGVNQTAIWTAFARRGMGVSAVAGSAFGGNVVEAFDVPLTLTITPSTIREDGGIAAAVGTLTRPNGFNGTPPLLVTLVNGDASEINIPSQIQFNAGQLSISFAIDAVDDSILDGTQNVNIIAQTADFNAFNTIAVDDYEPLSVTFNDPSIYENAGAGATTVTISRGSTALSSPDTYVVVNNALERYDSTGTLVSTRTIPYPGGLRPAGEDARDAIVLQNGRIAVMNGATTAYLSVFNPTFNFWQHIPVSGLTGSSAEPGSGGVASFGTRVFLADASNSGIDPGGVLMVNLTTSAVQRISAIPMRDINIGIDGTIYALDVPGTMLYKFDATTGFPVGTVSLPVPVRAIAVDAAGTIYGAGTAGDVSVISAAGSLTSVVNVGSDDLDDIDVNIIDVVLIGTAAGNYLVTDTTFSTITTFASSVAQDAFVLFDEHPTLSSGSVFVNLINGDPSEISVPQTVIIKAGQASATIPVDAVDDQMLDGTQTVTLTATSPGYASGSDTIDVLDYETVILDVIAAQVPESAGNGATQVQLTRSDVDGPFNHIERQALTDSVAKTILDNDVTFGFLTIPDQYSFVTDVNLTITLAHSWIADLDIYLVSPSGTRVELVTDLISNEPYMTGTIFDDEARISILHAASPFSGRVLPEGKLSDFDGENPSGTWRLEVIDDNLRDSGTLISWTLDVETKGPEALTVNLSSSDTSEATVASQVTIPANQLTASFPLNAVDDMLLDGTQTVT
ncbi:MAG: M36 family metallopeptidase, partial [Planctomycetaceae bacterium]|nr:M36 family metallopeptidase [Planctomycetaceae bacterium]